MKVIQKRCVECIHALRDPSAPVDQILVGNVGHLCLEGPPTTIPLATQGGIGLMTVYPSVNKDTISCDRFACETPAVAVAKV